MRDVTDSGGNSIYYVHRDALSTVAAETDASGALASEYRPALRLRCGRSSFEMIHRIISPR